MTFSRRCMLLALAGLAAVAAGAPSFAQSVSKPFVVYDDELKNGWQNWSWAKVALSVPAAEIKPIKVEGEPWSAVALHHEAFSTSPFTKVTFYINGGAEGGQNLMVKTLSEGKPVDSSYVIQPKARTWTVVEVPLKDIGADNKTIDGFLLQGQATAYKPYYVTRIQFE